jgi:small nuclear ribonucleoprotein (snRNP)-like protein
MASQTPTPTPTPTPIDQVAAIIGRKVICTLDDGRTLEGRLECLDRLSNIILRQVHETRIVTDPSIYGHGHDSGSSSSTSSSEEKKEMVIKRRLSQALIPGNHLVKVQLVHEVQV